MREIEESTVEKLTNKINVICFLVERLKYGEDKEKLEELIETCYNLIPDIKILLQKTDKNCN